MDYVPLDVEVRDSPGNSNQIRQSGYIPGIVYGQGIDPTPVQIKGTVLGENMRHHGPNTVYSINLNNQSMNAVVRDLQVDPVKKQYLHVDLQRISMDQIREARVPVRLAGKGRAESRGGVINQQLDYITVKGLPADIPEYIEINVSDMKIGDRLNISDLMIPNKLVVGNNPWEMVVSLNPAQPVMTDLNTKDETPPNAVPIIGNDEREINAT